MNKRRVMALLCAMVMSASTIMPVRAEEELQQVTEEETSIETEETVSEETEETVSETEGFSEEETEVEETPAETEEIEMESPESMADSMEETSSEIETEDTDSESDTVVVYASVQSGWYQDGADWYFYSNGAPVKEQFLTLGGVTYYFDYDGKMCTGYRAIQTNNETEQYIFGKSGALQKNKWIKLYVNDWYYALNDGKLAEGWKQIGGAWYWFDSSGRMKTGWAQINGKVNVFREDGRWKYEVNKSGWFLECGTWFYYQNGKPYTGWINNTYYIEYGIMQTDTVVLPRNGSDFYHVGVDGKKQFSWARNYEPQDIEGDWAYYDPNSGKQVRSAWRYINGNWYYFNHEGGMVDSPIWEVDGRPNRFASDGRWLGYENQTGWVKVRGRWYYIHSDKSLASGTETINGVTYYFEWDNTLLVNTVVDNTWWVDANGVRDTRDGWKTDGSNWYYVKDGKMYSGWLTIGGKKYYLGYEMCIGGYYVDGYYRFFDTDGIYRTSPNGWVSVKRDGKTEWYYLENGMPVTDEWRGAYYLDWNGQMAAGGNWYGYLFDADGHLVKNAWKYINGNWYYGDSTGHVYRGERTVNGKKYWFSSYDGRMIK